LAKLDQPMQRIGRYISRGLGIVKRIRALLEVLIAEPSRAAAFYRDLRRLSLRETAARLSRVIFQDAHYREWVELYDTISPREAEEIRRFLARLPFKPKFSVLVPVYQTPPKELTEMIASVKAQIYDDWELCIADDGSKQPHVREILEAEARAEPRIKLVFRAENGNISAASNSALALATGDFLVLLDHDDILAPHALAIMADAINRHPDADVLYSDEDKLDAQGLRYGAYFKPDWNAELLYGQNFISHLGVYRSSLVHGLGGFRLGFEGSQDYDLALRATAATKGPVVHVPHVLYHWRVYPGAGTFSSTQLGRAVDAARRAIKEQLAGMGVDASVGDAGYNCHRVIRANPATWPRVSIVVSLRRHPELLPDFVESLLEKTDYPDMEIIVVHVIDGEHALPTEMLNKRGVRLVQSPNPADFAKTINEAARDASGEIILFLDGDMVAVEPGWLKEMVLLATQPGVGAVGAKLRAADGKTWLGGMVLGLDQLAGHIQGNSAAAPGYFGKLLLTQEVSCVSAACMAVRRASFEFVGGYDESNLAPSFRDVDLCIRLRRAGYRVMWTPHARLHYRKSKKPTKSGSEGRNEREREIGYMRERFGHCLERDPFWNPNLSFVNRPQVSLPPRIARPWQEAGEQ
jgi:O-antigen biosynthesis protein